MALAKNVDKSIGIALVGAGCHAKPWIQAYGALEGVRITGIWDRDRALASSLAETSPGARVFGDMEELTREEEVWAAEINLPPGEAVDAALECLSAGIAVGLRSACIISSDDAKKLLAAAKDKVHIRLFSPSLYFPTVDLLLKDLKNAAVGDLQTMRIRVVHGRHGRSDDPMVAPAPDAAPDFCSPEFEALPLMFLLGEVQSVHVFRRTNAAIITWVSDRSLGGARFGVYEALRAPEMIVMSRLDPVDEVFEIAGTDGYLFGGGFSGSSTESPSYARYLGGGYYAPLGHLDEDPLHAYRRGAADLTDAARNRSAPPYGRKWVRLIGLLRHALKESLESGQEVRL